MDRSEADGRRDQTTALKDRHRPGEQEHHQPIQQEVTRRHTTDLTDVYWINIRNVRLDKSLVVGRPRFLLLV